MKLFFMAVLCLCTTVLYAQNVGIGVTTPLEKLHVDQNIRIGVGSWSSPLFNRYIKFGDGNYVTIGEVGLDDRLEFSAREFIFRNSGAYGVNNGKVGINTTGSPAAYLDVNGNVKITDGTQALGKVLTSGADGTASWQYTSNANTGFHASFESAVMTVQPNMDTLIIFENEQFDDGLGYNAATGIFTASADGTYMFSVKVQWQLTASTNQSLRVFLDKNGSKAEEAIESFTSSAATDIKTISFTSIIKMGAGDIIKVMARQDSGSNQEIMMTNTTFSGHRIY